MMKNWKLVGIAVSLAVIVMIESCAPQGFGEVHDAEEQLAKDIELIEEYIADKAINESAYMQYDTLDGDIRILVLDEGSGDPIEFNDIVSFHYIGRFLNDTIFDTSIKSLALEQDIANAIDTTYQKNEDGTPKLDDEGNEIIASVIYRPGYSAVFSATRNYAPYVATHTPGGWAAYQTLTGLISGFAPSAVFTLENVNLGGRVVALMPSSQAYGRFGSGLIPPNTVITFEFRPVSKR